MRTIHDHKVNGLNEAINILALDAPGPGGANHVYAILLQKPAGSLAIFDGNSVVRSEDVGGYSILHLAAGAIVILDRPADATVAPQIVASGQPGSIIVRFQNGPIGEAGFNGLTGEAFLALQIDRMRGFQHGRKDDGEFDFNSRGKFAGRENAVSLTDTESALMWLQKRTRDRMARGVEGTHKV